MFGAPNPACSPYRSMHAPLDLQETRSAWMPIGGMLAIKSIGGVAPSASSHFSVCGVSLASYAGRFVWIGWPPVNFSTDQLANDRVN